MKKIFIIFLIFYLSSCSKTEVVYSNQDNIYSFDVTDEKIIYLTFDDGYPYVNTKNILNILNEKNINATFFLEGNFMSDCRILINDIVDSGNIIGNHTYSHTPITYLSNYQIKQEFIKFENLYYEITNKELIKYFRPPEGKYTTAKLDYITELGYDIFFWNVQYVDYDRKNDLGADYAFDYVTKNTSKGDIILMHTLVDSNVEALPFIIDFFIEDGYEFKLLDYLVEKRENII